MPPAEYAANVRAAVANRLLADKTIEDEANRFWHEITMRQYVFERAEAEAAAMRAVGQPELARWARTLLLSDDARRLCVVVQPSMGVAAAPPPAAGAAADADAPPTPSVRVIDPEAFAASAPLHPRIEHALPAVVEK